MSIFRVLAAIGSMTAAWAAMSCALGWQPPQTLVNVGAMMGFGAIFNWLADGPPKKT